MRMISRLLPSVTLALFVAANLVPASAANKEMKQVVQSSSLKGFVMHKKGGKKGLVSKSKPKFKLPTTSTSGGKKNTH